ncbi:stage II sporulation protein M [Marininema mesophilum]|uniref:Stage II sporulation protein M n=1 Tax=Marininema mesophilum TaxID=1048340 RepID=A0A1H3CY59_9BACL|nr:stage II sporulation protein M [Marininema mesophilum]SDX58838.1 stage II sporulation protein M [Marininema mesophilum]
MRKFFEALREERKLLRLATLLLIGGAVFGYIASDSIRGMLTPIWDQLKETIAKIGKEPEFWEVYVAIWVNNMRAAATMIGLGLFFGVFPLVALLTNGVILGVVLGQASTLGKNPLWVFVQSILPHGILELPAIIIAAAFGIRLGLLVMQWMISWVSPTFRERNRKDWRHLFHRIPYVVGGVIILLIVAALIETSLIVYLKPV